MKYLIIILFGLLTGCRFSIDEELNLETAESVIVNYKKTGTVDSLLLNKANADEFLINEDYYLFVVNSFNGDFNGWIYANKPKEIPENLRFKNFVINSHGPNKGKWVPVYGKW